MLKSPSMVEHKVLQALTLVGPTWENLKQKPLSAQHLDNWLYMLLCLPRRHALMWSSFVKMVRTYETWAFAWSTVWLPVWSDQGFMSKLYRVHGTRQTIQIWIISTQIEKRILHCCWFRPAFGCKLKTCFCLIFTFFFFLFLLFMFLVKIW